MRRLLRRFVLIACAIAALPVDAQQLSIFGGVTRQRSTHEDSFAYSAAYSEPLNQTFSYSLGFVNEGHLTDHHRDGLGAQLWAGYNLTPRWSVKGGVGPYYYFDTAVRLPSGYANEHGFGLIASVSTSYQLSPHWGVELRANRIVTSRSIDTNSLLVGLGYTFDGVVLAGSSAAEASWRAEAAGRNEIAAYIGRTYVNDFDSPTATAYQVEYRRQLSRYIDWTVGAMSEGSPGPIDRAGALSEVWLMRRIFNDRADVGVGIGPYLAQDRLDENRTRLLGILSFTAGIKLSNGLNLRAQWHRVATRQDRDTDVFLLGAGIRW